MKSIFSKSIMIILFCFTYGFSTDYSNQERNKIGSTTGEMKERGHSHANQYIHMKPTLIADNMEPVMIHKSELKAANNKLKEMEKKFGKKPNIVFVLSDDTGWLDYGFNGGGIAVGNAIPNLNAYAQKGMVLTSAYSTPS